MGVVSRRLVCLVGVVVRRFSAGHQESRKCIFSLNVHFLSDTSCH